MPEVSEIWMKRITSPRITWATKPCLGFKKKKDNKPKTRSTIAIPSFTITVFYIKEVYFLILTFPVAILSGFRVVGPKIKLSDYIHNTIGFLLLVGTVC